MWPKCLINGQSALLMHLNLCDEHNGGTPPLADHKLSLDAQPEVRVMLGRKLAAMAPQWGAHAHPSRG